MSRNLADLHPLLAPLCVKHMEIFTKTYPSELCVLSFTYRSVAEQDALYRLGRNDLGAIQDRKLIVTNARGGHSWHNVQIEQKPMSLAYDLIIYDAARNLFPDDHIRWQQLGAIGLTMGLDWGVTSRNGTRWDLGHFFLRGTNRITLAEAMSGIQPRLAA